MSKTVNVTQKIMTDKEIKEFHAFEASLVSEPQVADSPQAQGIGSAIIRRLVRFAVSIVVNQAKRHNPDFDEEGFRAEVDRAVNAIGDGAIWDWLVNGGFAKILEWIMLLLQLFGGFARSRATAATPTA